MDSILNSTKKKIGIELDCNHFDHGDIIDHINSIFADLNQLGVGPKEGFVITGPDETWKDYLDGDKTLENVKTYMFLRLKLIFDPPPSAVISSYEKQIERLEFRLNLAAESEREEGSNGA